MNITLTLCRAGATQDLHLRLPPAASVGLDRWESASVSTALQVLQRTHDPVLGYALSCRRGLCKLCAMRIDGEVQTACTVPLRDGMHIAPAKPRLALLDTVVELSLVRHARAPSPATQDTPRHER